MAFLLNRQLNQNNVVYNRHNELIQKVNTMGESVTNIKFQMVYIKDELNKFDADRIAALQKLANNSNEL